MKNTVVHLLMVIIIIIIIIPDWKINGKFKY